MTYLHNINGILKKEIMQMNIDFHYFVIKTLACAAGFSEEDAQTIAYYSQQVDDFTKSAPMHTPSQ